jgi:two-component system sensor histidine kinase TctE
LLGWLLVPLGVLWLADAVDSYLRAEQAVNLAHDRALYASVLSIAERVTVAEGRPAVDLPPVALEVLDTDNQERVFYRVSYRSGDGPSVHLTGYSDLPDPPTAEPTPSFGLGDPIVLEGDRAPADAIPPPRASVFGPTYRDTTYRGDAVRIAWLRRVLPTAPPIEVEVQVAETLGGLVRLRRAMIGREMAFEFGAILLAIVALMLGVWRGLHPLRQLSRDVTARSATDLSPIPFGRVPREVGPVVASVNELLGRLRDAMESQARFIADASHALRTPLAVLRSEADLLLRQEDPAELRKAVANLRAHVEATSHLASQLLALARAGRRGAPPALEWFDLASSAREACSALVPAALERGVDLGYAGESSVLALGRELEIHEVIGNLVDNALRYGRPRGVVTVSVTRAGGGAVLAVEDDGPGIPAEHRDSVLLPFHRLPGSPGDGSGLGLAIVREIAAHHGGPLKLTEGTGNHGLRVELMLRALEDGAPIQTAS